MELYEILLKGGSVRIGVRGSKGIGENNGAHSRFIRNPLSSLHSLQVKGGGVSAGVINVAI